MEPAAATRGKQRTYALRPRQNTPASPVQGTRRLLHRCSKVRPPSLPPRRRPTSAADDPAGSSCAAASRKGAAVCVRRGQGRKRGSPAYFILERLLAYCQQRVLQRPQRGSRSTSRIRTQLSAHAHVLHAVRRVTTSRPAHRGCAASGADPWRRSASRTSPLSMHASSPMKASTATLSLARSQRAAAGDLTMAPLESAVEARRSMAC